VAASLRITAPRCIGCGAIETWGTCESGCCEERLDLVTAVEYDETVAASEASARRIAALRDAVRAVAALSRDGGDDAERWDRARRVARAALERHRAPAADLEAPEVVTTWTCPDCLAVSAPQPCIGVCIRRPVDWVPAADHAAAGQELDRRTALERDLRGALTLVAFVAPRDGRWEDAWRAFRERAFVDSTDDGGAGPGRPGDRG
jgi:hypothetical protein